METEKNKKSKFLLLPVNLLVALVLIVLCGLGFLLFEALTPQYVEAPRETHFVCGTCEDLKREKANYTENGRDGKALFKANCAQCHTTTDKASTGPGMMGVLDRIPGGDWRYRFVRNEDSMFKAGDPYTVAVRKQYRGRNCMEFPQLTNEEIDAILAYANH